MAGLTVAADVAFLCHSREKDIAEATSRLDDATHLIDDHILRSFRATSSVLQQVEDVLRPLPMDQVANNASLWRHLTSLAHALPEPGTLWIADGDGVVQLGSAVFPTPPAPIGEEILAEGKKLKGGQPLIIGPLSSSNPPAEGSRFHLAQRMDEANGRTLGLVIAAFDSNAYTDFYQNLGLGSQSSITLLRPDGNVILRQPQPDRWAGSSVAHSPVMQAIRQGQDSGTIRATSPFDKIERLVSYRTIPEYGIVSVVSMGMDDILMEWRQTVLWVVLLNVAVAGALGAVAVVAFRSLAREEEVIRTLERTVETCTDEARAQTEEARRANDSKSRFLAAASHDLRQPLQAAGMFAEVLALRLEASPDIKVVDKLRQSIDATQALLSTLLDVSTLEAGKVEPTIAPFALRPVLRSLADQMEPDATARGLTLRHVPCSARVLTDPILLERMLRNLLVNALRYTLSGKVLLGCRRRGDKLAICVMDTGPGIPADKFETIFEDFTRLSDKGSGAQRGLGLGLGVVRRMAKLLDLSVSVQSVEGKGACFSVLVPLAPEN